MPPKCKSDESADDAHLVRYREVHQSLLRLPRTPATA